MREVVRRIVWRRDAPRGPTSVARETSHRLEPNERFGRFNEDAR